MSVNVYLTSKIRESEDFDTDKKGTPCFCGLRLSQNEGRFFVGLNSLTAGVDEKLKPFVEEISFNEMVNNAPMRQFGVYRASDIEAEVEGLQFNKESYKISMRGKMEDMPAMLALYRQIRAGTIQPEESWSDEQLTQPRAKTEAELAEALGELEKLNDTAVSLKISREMAKTTLRLIRKGLENRWLVRAGPLLEMVDAAMLGI